MKHCFVILAAIAVPAVASAQAPRTTWREPAVHYGKWLTAGATVAFTVFAAREHRSSRRDWDALLVICRSAQTACTLGPDGRYLRSDAELLYQSSRVFDRRATRRLLGAQASLLVTAALFILDLHPGRAGPDNIPFSPLRVTLEPTGDGAAVGLQLRF
jgi:predicted deacylase